MLSSLGGAEGPIATMRNPFPCPHHSSPFSKIMVRSIVADIEKSPLPFSEGSDVLEGLSEALFLVLG